MPYHYTPIRMAKIQNTDNTKCWWGYGASGTLICCRWYHLLQNGTATLEDSLVVSYKVKHSLTIGSSNRTPTYLPKLVKIYIHMKICTWMSTAALFILAKTWKQPRCPSVGEWINKLWYIQTVEYYSALKRNELPRHEKTWRTLKHILLSKRSQSEKVAILYDSNYVTFWQRQNYGDNKKTSCWLGFGGVRDE